MYGYQVFKIKAFTKPANFIIYISMHYFNMSPLQCITGVFHLLGTRFSVFAAMREVYLIIMNWKSSIAIKPRGFLYGKPQKYVRCHTNYIIPDATDVIVVAAANISETIEHAYSGGHKGDYWVDIISFN